MDGRETRVKVDLAGTIDSRWAGNTGVKERHTTGAFPDNPLLSSIPLHQGTLPGRDLISSSHTMPACSHSDAVVLPGKELN